MMKPITPLFFLCLLAVLVAPGLSAIAQAPASNAGQVQANPPNILFLFTDDQRFDTLGVMGNEIVRTPNIDRLAGRGLVFDRAYIMGGSSPAVCSPSRAMLFSGRTLWNLENQGLWGFEISDQVPTMFEVFRDAGYMTWATGKNEPGRSGHFARSFSGGDAILFRGMTRSQYNLPLFSYSPEGDYAGSRAVVSQGVHSAEVYADAAINFLESRDADAPPFFAYVSFQTPHDPRQFPEAFADAYPVEGIPLPDSFVPEHPFDNGMLRIRDENLAGFPRGEQEVRRHIAEYYATIEHTDAQVGRILAALDASGEMDNTIVVFTSDNGLAVGRHGLMGKQNVYDHSVHVPLIVAGPGIVSGERREQMCYIYDMVPTLLERAGLVVPETVEFESLNEVIADADAAHRDALYFAFMSWQRAYQDDRYKLIEYCVEGDRHTQLFDLQEDPHELENLVGRPEHMHRMALMRRRLQALAEDLNDGNSTSDFATQMGESFWQTFDTNPLAAPGGLLE